VYLVETSTDNMVVVFVDCDDRDAVLNNIFHHLSFFEYGLGICGEAKLKLYKNRQSKCSGQETQISFYCSFQDLLFIKSMN
jgi:hypothetical protein